MSREQLRICPAQLQRKMGNINTKYITFIYSDFLFKCDVMMSVMWLT